MAGGGRDDGGSRRQSRHQYNSLLRGPLIRLLLLILQSLALLSRKQEQINQ